MTKLKDISKPALDRWSKLLDGALSDELIDYFKRRVWVILNSIDYDLGAECSLTQTVKPDELLRLQILSLEKGKYQAMIDGLLEAFKEEIKLLNLDIWDNQLALSQVELLVKVIEESIAIDLMPALFYQAKKLELERQNVVRMLREVHCLLERDRQRLAFDLHDGAAQTISSALLQTDILGDLVGSAEAKRELESLKNILSQCLHELRISIYSLRPQSNSKQGLNLRLKEFVKQFSSKTGIEVNLHIQSKEKEIPADMQVSVFRVIQEALNNIHKHAHATRARIDISFGDSSINCSIKDNGIGFDVESQDRQVKDLGGYGLVSMRGRVEQFFGTFKVSSMPGEGTCVIFNLPL